MNQPHSKGANTDAAPSAAWGCRLPPQARPAPAPAPLRSPPQSPLPSQTRLRASFPETFWKKNAAGAGRHPDPPCWLCPLQRARTPAWVPPAVTSICGSFTQQEFTEHLLCGKQDRHKSLTSRNSAQQESQTESGPQTENKSKCGYSSKGKKEGTETDDKGQREGCGGLSQESQGS